MVNGSVDLAQPASIGAEDVVLQVEAVGICGSDLHYYKDGGIGPARLEIDVSSGARDAHGDRVIAFGGAVMLLGEVNPESERPVSDYGKPDFSWRSMLNMDDDIWLG